jgi:hypothetical protein
LIEDAGVVDCVELPDELLLPHAASTLPPINRADPAAAR